MSLSKMFLTLLLSGILGLSAIGSATAATNGLEVNSPEVDLAAIRVQQTQLRATVQAGDDIYGEMGNVERNQLLGRQDNLLQLIEGKSSFDELNERQQLEAFNTLEWINAVVNDAKDQRMICTRESRVGSHRKTKVCKTVAQRREEREESRRKLQLEFQGGFCEIGGSCSGG